MDLEIFLLRKPAITQILISVISAHCKITQANIKKKSKKSIHSNVIVLKSRSNLSVNNAGIEELRASIIKRNSKINLVKTQYNQSDGHAKQHEKLIKILL